MLTPDQLSPAQLERFQQEAERQQVSIEDLLIDFTPDLWMPGAITGTLPWCGLYGLVEADGRSHT